MTTSWSRGISTLMFLRLCSRAPRTTSLSFIVENGRADERNAASNLFRDERNKCSELTLYTGCQQDANKTKFHAIMHSVQQTRRRYEYAMDTRGRVGFLGRGGLARRPNRNGRRAWLGFDAIGNVAGHCACGGVFANARGDADIVDSGG